MGIGTAFDQLMNWTMEGSTAASFTKFIGVLALPTAAIMAPIQYFSSNNAEDLERTFEDLDSRPTIVFQSVASCTNEGYSYVDCEASQQVALDISDELGTTVSYSSESKCAQNHGSCDQRIWMQPMIISTGKTTIINQIPHTAYTPPIVAWQAAASDLSVSVPLYSGPEKGTAVRKDGRTLDLDF